MVKGVAQVSVFGAQKYAVRIRLDPRALSSRGIPIGEVSSAIQEANVNLPTGILWGPMAGYYAKKASPPLHVTPLVKETTGPRLAFRIGMGVRSADQNWKRLLNRVIQERERHLTAHGSLDRAVVIGPTRCGRGAESPGELQLLDGDTARLAANEDGPAILPALARRLEQDGLQTQQSLRRARITCRHVERGDRADASGHIAEDVGAQLLQHWTDLEIGGGGSRVDHAVQAPLGGRGDPRLGQLQLAVHRGVVERDLGGARAESLASSDSSLWIRFAISSDAATEQSSTSVTSRRTRGASARRSFPRDSKRSPSMALRSEA